MGWPLSRWNIVPRSLAVELKGQVVMAAVMNRVR